MPLQKVEACWVAPLGAGPRLATAGERGRGRMFAASVRLGRAAPLTWGATFCTGRLDRQRTLALRVPAT